jgi:hypothetical protein
VETLPSLWAATAAAGQNDPETTPGNIVGWFYTHNRVSVNRNNGTKFPFKTAGCKLMGVTPLFTNRSIIH